MVGHDLGWNWWLRGCETLSGGGGVGTKRGWGTYVFPEDEGQDCRRELRQEDDEDEQEELQREEAGS